MHFVFEFECKVTPCYRSHDTSILSKTPKLFKMISALKSCFMSCNQVE